MSETSRKRPWLAVVLALLVTGLGHAYLRRWGRAFGWFLAVTAVGILFVPEAAIEQLYAGTGVPIGDLFPVFAVIAASVIDAYVVAVRHNRDLESASVGVAGTDRVTPEGDASAPAGAAVPPEAPRVVECPHCGREVDAELDFCHWCTEDLPKPDGN